MAVIEASKVGKRGAVIIPAKLRRRFGIKEGSFVIAEERDDGMLLRPAAVLPVEIYTPERRAEFLLGSATNAEEYAQAVAEVRALGLDPEQIDHFKPRGV